MFIIVSFLYMAFYLHDKVVMGSAGISYILENAADYAGSTSEIEADTKEILESRLIISENIQVSASADSGAVLECSADIQLPFDFISQITGTDLNSVSSQLSISSLDARSTLLKYKAAADGVQSLSE